MTAPARQRLVEVVESAVRRVLDERFGPGGPVNAADTVDVKGAAELLHTTVRAIYQRRHTDKMPTPLSKRPLVWRRADLLKLPR